MLQVASMRAAASGLAGAGAPGGAKSAAAAYLQRSMR
jgi:hypothetical protein